jgi:hypothetical protein
MNEHKAKFWSRISTTAPTCEVYRQSRGIFAEAIAVNRNAIASAAASGIREHPQYLLPVTEAVGRQGEWTVRKVCSDTHSASDPRWPAQLPVFEWSWRC